MGKSRSANFPEDFTVAFGSFFYLVFSGYNQSDCYTIFFSKSWIPSLLFCRSAVVSYIYTSVVHFLLLLFFFTSFLLSGVWLQNDWHVYCVRSVEPMKVIRTRHNRFPLYGKLNWFSLFLTWSRVSERQALVLVFDGSLDEVRNEK